MGMHLGPWEDDGDGSWVRRCVGQPGWRLIAWEDGNWGVFNDDDLPVTYGYVNDLPTAQAAADREGLAYGHTFVDAFAKDAPTYHVWAVLTGLDDGDNGRIVGVFNDPRAATDHATSLGGHTWVTEPRALRLWRCGALWVGIEYHRVRGPITARPPGHPAEGV